MAIHAKRSGMMIAGKIIAENASVWIFQAMDNKHPTVISKSGVNGFVFDGDTAVYDAAKWTEEQRK